LLQREGPLLCRFSDAGHVETSTALMRPASENLHTAHTQTIRHVNSDGSFLRKQPWRPLSLDGKGDV